MSPRLPRPSPGLYFRFVVSSSWSTEETPHPGRHGTIDARDEPGKHLWSFGRGAIYNVNYDSDGGRMDQGVRLPDAIGFNNYGEPEHEHWKIDANGDDLDITPIHIGINLQSLPTGWKAFLRLPRSEDVRRFHMFKQISVNQEAIWGAADWGPNKPASFATSPSIDITQWVGSGSAVFGIEGLFLAGMDGGFGPFDGFLEFVLELRKGDGTLLGSDKIRMKVAPWIMLPHTQPSNRLFAANLGPLNQPFREDLAAELQSTAFRTVGGAGQWLQDHVEIGYYQRPGGPKTIATFRLPYGSQPTWPLSELLGPNRAVFQLGSTFEGKGLDSGGNLELLPPVDDQCLGAIVIGAGASTNLMKFLRAQKAQSVWHVPTRWLRVGHADEVLAFTQDPNRILLADPALAYQLMESINPADRGSHVLFGIGQTLAGVVRETHPDPNTLLTDFDLRDSSWNYVRIYEGPGSGQVGTIIERGDRYLKVAAVWDTSSEILDINENETHCYARYFGSGGFSPTDNYGWFPSRAPQGGASRFVLVEGSQPLKVTDQIPAFLTVSEVLQDDRLREINLTRAAQQIEDAKGSIITAARWRELTFIRVPVIYLGHYGPQWDFGLARSAYALTPNLANAQAAEDVIFSPWPEGPRTTGGDLFENWLRAAVPETSFVRSWEYYHLYNGDVHCGTNVEREPFDYDWWTTRIE